MKNVILYGAIAVEEIKIGDAVVLEVNEEGYRTVRLAVAHDFNEEANIHH